MKPAQHTIAPAVLHAIACGSYVGLPYGVRPKRSRRPMWNAPASLLDSRR
jgi:hypothetical protein